MGGDGGTADQGVRVAVVTAISAVTTSVIAGGFLLAATVIENAPQPPAQPNPVVVICERVDGELECVEPGQANSATPP